MYLQLLPQKVIMGSIISNDFKIHSIYADNDNCEPSNPQCNPVPGSNCNIIRYDLLKVLYAGMLLNLTPDELRQFWKNHPLPSDNYSKDERNLYIELFQGHSWYSADYVFSVFNDFENFLTKTGKNILEFIENSFLKINKGLLISPRSWLSMSKPIFKLFFTEPDFRVLILRLIDHYLHSIAPCFRCKIAFHSSDLQWNKSILMLQYNDNQSSNCIDTGSNNCSLFKIDAELWFAALIKNIPQAFNLPCFEHMFMTADIREISNVVENVSISGDYLYIDQQLAAERMSFDNFCSFQGIDAKSLGISRSSVWVMRYDYLCPIRKRIILHQGCAYGAPVILFGFHFLKLNRSPDNFLDSIIDDIVNYNDFRWSEIKVLHNTLINKLTCYNNFTYNRKNETMQLNGIDFVKYVPARILRKVLQTYVETGRTEFHHSEFVKDSSIIDDPYQPNFAVRLKRLMCTLENSKTSISLQKVSKGKFIFRTAFKIIFNEIT